MGLLAEHVAAVIQRQGGELRVRLASRDPMVEAYLGWCERRDSPGDCLDLLDTSSPGLSSSAKRSIFGALLKDPSRLLEGTGKRGRHVKLRPGREVDSVALAQLVDAAYVDIRARLRK